MLLAYPLELGFDREDIDRMVEDTVAGSSILFVLDSSNLSPVVFNQTNGIQYDFLQVFREVEIISSTLDYYWFEG